MNIVRIQKKTVSIFLVAVFLILLFLKDFIGIGIPDIVFSGVWILLLIFADKSTAAAFSVSSVICFASTLSITIPSALFIVMSLLSKRFIKISTVFIVSMYVVLAELVRLFLISGENFKQYVNSMVVLLLVWVIIDGLRRKEISAETCIKFYIGFFVFLSLDIIWATAKTLGGFLNIINGNFRIGQVEMLDENVEGIFSVNANGIALMALLAISLIMLLVNKQMLKKRFAIPLMIYFSIVGFLTISKTFILVCAGFWLLYMCWYVIKSRANIFKFLAFVAMFAVLIALMWNTDIIQNIIVRFSESDLTTGRIEIAVDYINQLFDDPKAFLVGVGLQNVTEKMSMIYVPHNAILEIFVCFGIVGLVIYAAFFVSLIYSAIIYIRRENDSKNSFINFITLIVWAVFIQSLQFLRINYIYASIAIVFASMILCVRGVSVKKEEIK